MKDDIDGKALEIFKKSVEKKFESSHVEGVQELHNPRPNHAGSLRLDINLSIPFHTHSIHEIFGGPGTGKSTLALSVLAEAIKRDKIVAFVDQEKSLNQSLVKTFPNLVDTLTILRANTGEDALNMTELFLRQFPGSVVVLDSVDALLPGRVIDKEIGEPTVGTLAMLMSQGCRSLNQACADTGSTLIFLNQMRSKITAYGDPNTTSGGRALPFYASQRVHLFDVTKSRMIKDESGNTIGHKAKFYITKNKVAPPYIEGEFPLIYGKGIDKESELIDLARQIEILPSDGKYIVIDGKKRYPKIVAEMMRADPDFYQTIYQRVIAEYPETYCEPKS